MPRSRPLRRPLTAAVTALAAALALSSVPTVAAAATPSAAGPTAVSAKKKASKCKRQCREKCKAGKGKNRKRCIRKCAKRCKKKQRQKDRKRFAAALSGSRLSIFQSFAVGGLYNSELYDFCSNGTYAFTGVYGVPPYAPIGTLVDTFGGGWRVSSASFKRIPTGKVAITRQGFMSVSADGSPGPTPPPSPSDTLTIMVIGSDRATISGGEARADTTGASSWTRSRSARPGC